MNTSRKSHLKNILLSMFAAIAINQSALAGNIDYTATPNHYLSVEGSKYAYRTLGESNGKPALVLFQHFTGTMDDWDSALINRLANKRQLYIFDNAGVGATEGTAPDNIPAMAKNAEKFIDALKLKKVDILGFSMGGSIGQQVLLDRPELVRKAILVGTAPQGYTSEGGKELPVVMGEAFKKAGEAKTHPKVFLFFTETSEGQAAATEFLKRISNHTVDAEKPTSEATTNAQATAIVTWGRMPSNLAALEKVKQPVLIVNGSNDVMAPTSMSFELFKHFQNAQLSLYPNSGHGALFQYSDLFVSQVDTFLDAAY